MQYTKEQIAELKHRREKGKGKKPFGMNNDRIAQLISQRANRSYRNAKRATV